MAFFFGLLSITLLVWLVSRLIKRGPFQQFWKAAQVATMVMFLQVGVMHLISPASLSYMIKGIMPFPETLVVLSGITEIILALGLVWRKYQKIAAGLLIVQLVAMFPANINVAVNALAPPGGLPSEGWYVWSRLFFQPIYIFWIYRAFLSEARFPVGYNQPNEVKNSFLDQKQVTTISENHSKTLSK